MGTRGARRGALLSVRAPNHARTGGVHAAHTVLGGNALLQCGGQAWPGGARRSHSSDAPRRLALQMLQQQHTGVRCSVWALAHHDVLPTPPRPRPGQELDLSPSVSSSAAHFCQGSPCRRPAGRHDRCCVAHPDRPRAATGCGGGFDGRLPLPRGATREEASCRSRHRWPLWNLSPASCSVTRGVMSRPEAALTRNHRPRSCTRLDLQHLPPASKCRIVWRSA